MANIVKIVWLRKQSALKCFWEQKILKGIVVTTDSFQCCVMQQQRNTTRNVIHDS